MYPGTKVEWVDQSYISALPTTETSIKPLYAQTFTSDKGPETWKLVEGDEFFKLYGDNISFAKHGQPLLQSAMSINWGAKVLARRITADDSTLANLSVFAKVAESTTQKVDADGNLVYKDDGDNETVEETENPVMIKCAKITYFTKTVSGAKNETDGLGNYLLAKNKIEYEIKKHNTNVDEFLLFTIFDNGRGVSNKRFLITPDYYSSKAYDFTMYKFSVMENGSVIESTGFTLDPDLIINNQNISLSAMIRTRLTQVECVQYDENIQAFIDRVQEISGLDDAEISENDIMFGCTRKGVSLNTVSVDYDSENAVNLSYTYGLSLESGNNGSFGSAPVKSEDYGPVMARAYTDDPTTLIYDIDRYQIDAIIDANYPNDVKRAIEALADFREDFVYFRDMGTDLTTYNEIILADKLNSKSKFCATYHNSYDILDPYSRKRVRVTVGYDLARLLISHFDNGRNLPLAGTKHNFVISSALPDSINFIPVITPKENQKEMMNDSKINYASYIGDDLVIETLYTSYDKNSQFSYINNILITQEVVKAIRRKCVTTRYTFLDADDFEKYKSDVREVISKYESYFKSIEMEYIEDDNYITNKVFYAAIKATFRDFVQAEYFKIIAINQDDSIAY